MVGRRDRCERSHYHPCHSRVSSHASALWIDAPALARRVPEARSEIKGAAIENGRIDAHVLAFSFAHRSPPTAGHRHGLLPQCPIGTPDRTSDRSREVRCSASLDTDDFKGGLGDWSVEGGNWAKGKPTADFGPAPVSGAQVWGTNLRGNYLDNNGSGDFETRARLVSPELFIDEDSAAPRLRVAFWHELTAGDAGRFQVSVDGQSWEDLPGDQMTGASGGWGQRVVELDEYDGRRVRLGLLLSTTNQSGGSVDVASGLYVDDASFVTE